MNIWRFLPFLLLLILLSFCAIFCAKIGRAHYYKFPTAETHHWFKECAVKRRINPRQKGSFELHTLFAHAKMDKSVALFFDLSNQYNGYVADEKLLHTCNDDKSASKGHAIKMKTAKCDGSEFEFTTFNKEKEIRIKAGCRNKENNKQYHLYSCHWKICNGNKYILVKRPSHGDLRKIYYIDDDDHMHKLKCLENVCKIRQMEELHSTNLKDDGEKTKRHKLFFECAVKKKNEDIETLIKNIPLDDNQILFFGISANIYVGNRLEKGMTETCENDKESKMILPINYARLKLDSRGRLLFKYTIKGEKMKNGKKVKSAKAHRKYITEVMNIHLRTGKEQHCAAFTRFGAYNVLFCPMQICGKHKLILLKKTKKSKRKGQAKTLMDGEKVNVDHIYVVKMKHVEVAVMRFLRQKCKNTLTILEGVSREAHSHPTFAAIGNSAHSNNEAKKKDEYRKHGHENSKNHQKDDDKKEKEKNDDCKKGGRQTSHCGGHKNHEHKKHSKSAEQKRAERKAKKEAKEHHANSKDKFADVISPGDLFNEHNEAKKHESHKEHKKEHMADKSSPHEFAAAKTKPKTESSEVKQHHGHTEHHKRVHSTARKSSSHSHGKLLTSEERAKALKGTGSKDTNALKSRYL